MGSRDRGVHGLLPADWQARLGENSWKFRKRRKFCIILLVFLPRTIPWCFSVLLNGLQGRFRMAISLRFGSCLNRAARMLFSWVGRKHLRGRLPAGVWEFCTGTWLSWVQRNPNFLRHTALSVC